MNRAPSPAATAELCLATPEATGQLAVWLAPKLLPGDVILLEGPMGAGKSHFARGLIQSRLAAQGRMEDVPSPTFTLVQVYDLGSAEIWHVDLYRLASVDEVMELGLLDAFETAICLVEWPDRLDRMAPEGALRLKLTPAPGGDARTASISASSQRWAPVLADLESCRWTVDD